MTLKVEVSNGNHKLGKDTLILNMSSATDCPSRAAELCAVGDICYARKAERQYPAVLPYRRRQEQVWRRLSAEEMFYALLSIVMRKRHSIKYLRVNESGDFHKQCDVYKLDILSYMLNRHLGIGTYVYTARSDLSYSNLNPALVVNGSHFMVHNSFDAIADTSSYEFVCESNCRNCNLCKERGGRRIAVKFH